MYNDGLLGLLDTDTSDGFLGGWEWLFGGRATAMATTGMGDVFFWDSTTEAVSWLNVAAGGTIVAIDRDPQWFLDEYLLKSAILDKVLRRRYFNSLIAARRPLQYHEVLILVPWMLLGGEDRPEHYTIGHCGVYVDLVGQTIPQLGGQQQ